jgi:hypothetical protein
MKEKWTTLLNTVQAAERLSLAPHTLEADRCERRFGIPYIKIGRSVRYREEDVVAFIEKNRIVPSEYE